ncbi:MAG: hypothetical protein GXY82_01685 [Methanospirillum sp.]|nr:hypothetical protein [Methanospirillum sp.]
MTGELGTAANQTAVQAGCRPCGEWDERDGDEGRDAEERRASLPGTSPPLCPERKEDHPVENLSAAIRARDVASRPSPGPTIRAVVGTAAARATGQQWLPV